MNYAYFSGMWANWKNKIEPNTQISQRILWDMNMENFDWQKCRTVVVQRVIEWGSMNDFYAMINLYKGIENVKEIIREIPRLNNPRDISFVCATFGLKKEELKCYTQKRLREVH